MSVFQNSKQVRRRIIVLMIIIATFLLILWISQPATFSHLVMTVVSTTAESVGVAAEADMKMQFENPKNAKNFNWFSEMCLYNAMDLTEADLGLKGHAPVDLSIYYTFGDFKNGRSLIYDLESEYHNAFYGAYVVRGLGDISGRPEVLEAIARFDYTQLILSGLGCPPEAMRFKTSATSVFSPVTYCGYPDWTQFDATVDTLSVNHKVTTNLQHYIQFGKPLRAEQMSSFGATQIYGRMYAKYFNEQEVCVIFYIMTPDQVLLARTDEQLLSKTSIRLP